MKRQAHLRTRLSALAPGQAWFDIACGMGNGRIRSTESQWLNCLTRSKKEACHKHYMSRSRDNAERGWRSIRRSLCRDQLHARELSRRVENLLSRTPRTRQHVSKDSARDGASVLDHPLDQKAHDLEHAVYHQPAKILACLSPGRQSTSLETEPSQKGWSSGSVRRF